MKIAALVSYYNDLDFISHQYNSGQFNVYDEVYIIDGPFGFARDFEIIDPMSVPFSESVVGKNILLNNKFKYFFRQWSDEFEKRTFAYNIIDADLIVLHDSDEFYHWDKDELQKFIASESYVGSFYCQNLYIDGLYCSNKFYSTKEKTKLPHKNFIFKKEKISAKEHIDYLWLVGVLQAKPDRNLVYNKPLAFGYHFTGMRSATALIQKYVFYISLHNKGLNESAMGKPIKKLIESGKILNNEGLDALLNSTPGYLNLPNIDGKSIINERIIIDELEWIHGKIKSELNFRPLLNFILIPGLTRYIYIQSGNNLRIYSNPQTLYKINIELCDLIMGEILIFKSIDLIKEADYIDIKREFNNPKNGYAIRIKSFFNEEYSRVRLEII